MDFIPLLVLFIIFILATSPLWIILLVVRNKQVKAREKLMSMPQKSLNNIVTDEIKVPVKLIWKFGLNLTWSYNLNPSTILLCNDSFVYSILLKRRILFEDIKEIDVGLPIVARLPTLILFSRKASVLYNDTTLKIKIRSFFPNILYLSFDEDILSKLIPFFILKNIQFSQKAKVAFSRFMAESDLS